MSSLARLCLLGAGLLLAPLAHAGLDAITPAAGVPVKYVKFEFESSKVQTFAPIPTTPVVTRLLYGTALELECVEASVTAPVWMKDGVKLVASERIRISGRKVQIPYLVGGADDGVYTVSGLQIQPLQVEVLGAPAPQDLLNSSSRGVLRVEGDHVTQGFVIGGTVQRMVVVRAIGPALAGFGVKNPLPSPKLVIYDGAGAVKFDSTGPRPAVDRSIQLALARALGAFDIPLDSKDEIAVCTLQPGNYTAVVTSLDGKPGDVLVEIYIAP